MWLIWLACRPASHGPAGTGGHPPPAADSADSATTAAVPLLDVALAERCPSPREGQTYPEGDDLRRVTLAGAGRCNDGTAPVLYARAATDPAHADDWVWVFDGGGLCDTYESCAVRWCGEDPPFGARHMSSRFAPETRGGAGISSPDPANAFAGWNVVVAAYCTSDQWTGRRGDLVFDGAPDYRLLFEGDQVAADGIAAGVAGIVSDDGAEALPSLGDAENVVVVGTSAGCQGAAVHAADLAAAAPGAEQRVVLDSTFYPAPEIVDPKVLPPFEDLVRRFWERAGVAVWDTRVPAACLADHPGEEWRCFDLDTVMRGDYVGAPVLQHHDLEDPVVYDYYAAVGLGLGEYAQLAVDTFRFYEDAAPALSVHANACAAHTAIDGDGTFLRATVVDALAGGAAWSEHDAVVAFVGGERVIAVDTAPSTTSTCE